MNNDLIDHEAVCSMSISKSSSFKVPTKNRMRSKRNLDQLPANLIVATCLAGVVLAQDYQEYRQAPLRIGTKAEEPKPTPVPILKQINRSGYYRKRCFTAVRNNCKLRSGDKTHSKFNPTGPRTIVEGAEARGSAVASEAQRSPAAATPGSIVGFGGAKKKLFKTTSVY
ncbi:AGAP000345-PB-like protein [Anopheles sinensis]|uniref:AGAP000345-PB-like protein n=1 Tax=Anopheles sinensis TaxID=74873 RepID=A0A084VN34_ANOSI|nr:AGAP000345-PB-like protein [Anopheles sinensis]